MQYRRLEKGEIIKKGDQCDQCVNPWKDKPKWMDVVGNIGEPAPDPEQNTSGSPGGCGI
jgi:hypothetical protein